MKAFEAMERKQQRRKESVSEIRDEKPSSGLLDGAPKRRRRSSSFKLTANADSNLDVSSADESKPEPKRAKRKGRKVGGPLTPQRRRSRIMSGGTASALSTDEDHALTNTGSQDATTPGGNSVGPFRFPKTKKSLMTDWLQESNDTNSASVPNDDDVSANYLRGSRSPPGIATHLLRSSAPMSPVKNVCSAKKRWLRQAISEDHTDDAPVNGNASPSGSDACFGDYVTPLKKRRLASYKDEQDHCSGISDPSRSPNGLKNKLLSNLVLEAVLDRALEDMAGGGSAVARSVSVDSVAEDLMSSRTPDQSPTKDQHRHQSTDETCGSSRDAFSNESPTKADEDEDDEEEEEEEEEAAYEEEFARQDNEDEQVEVEETSSVAGDLDEASQQSQEVDIEVEEEISEAAREEAPDVVDDAEEVEEEEGDDDDEDVKVDVESEDVESPDFEPEAIELREKEENSADLADVEHQDPAGDDEASSPAADDEKASVEVEEEDEEDEEAMDVKEEKEEFHPQEDENAQQEAPASVEPEVKEEAEVFSPEVSFSERKEAVTPIKTPEPSSVFKSFFTSNVSIEELEAEIEASKKARLEEDVKMPTTPSESSSPAVYPTVTTLPNFDTVVTEATVRPSPVEEAADHFSRTSIDRRDSETSLTAAYESSSLATFSKTNLENHHSEDSSSSNLMTSKPKEKKRFSLADYKKRRQTEGHPVAATEASTPVQVRNDDRDGPGTPTLDEELASLAAPPTLNTLPLFEKLEKLEKAQKESKLKGN